MSKLDAFKEQMDALHRAYVQQLPHKVQQIEELWRAVSAGTPDNDTLQLLYHLVHKLSGSGPTFGFTSISERAGCLEEAIKRLMANGVAPSPEEKQRVDQAVASLRLIAAAAAAERPGFSSREEESEDRAVSMMDAQRSVHKNYTILVVDDEAFLRKKLVLILREAGFRVEEAENGVAALTQAQIQRPDVILMDYLMPVMDGVEAIRHLRQDPLLCKTPILLLTTHQKINDVQRALDCDVNGYLAKPFDPVQVIEQVKAFLPTATANGYHAANGHATQKKHILIVDDYVLYRRKRSSGSIRRWRRCGSSRRPQPPNARASPRVMNSRRTKRSRRWALNAACIKITRFWWSMTRRFSVKNSCSSSAKPAFASRRPRMEWQR